MEMNKIHVYFNQTTKFLADFNQHFLLILYKMFIVLQDAVNQ